MQKTDPVRSVSYIQAYTNCLADLFQCLIIQGTDPVQQPAFIDRAQLFTQDHRDPCLEVSTMFLSEHQNQNIQISAYLSHFFYAKNYFNFFVFMI